MDVSDKDIPSYYFETPASEPDPELLKLLPQKSLFEQVIDFGLYFVAVFQVSNENLFVYLKIYFVILNFKVKL